MRRYSPKENLQKKAYYSNRFKKEPTLPREEVSNDPVFAQHLEALQEINILESYIMRGQLVIIINPEDNVKALKIMKDVCGYNQLSEMSAIDWLAQDGEFEVFYQLLNMSVAKRARIKCRIKENQAIETVTSLYNSANWSEREMYDMFGIAVNNHPYLKRIMMPDDWHGYPLRKSYPLQGDETAQWWEVDKIYGKEYRDVIGPELRDAAYIDRHDTKRFARLGHEVPFGTPVDENGTPIRYQEDDKPFLCATLDQTKTVTLEKRK
jgi:NADH-quinone oxidoreductase subunit C